MSKAIIEDRFNLKKTIYAKRFHVTKEQILEIMALEIETHTRKHQDLVFKKLHDPVENSDRSKTFTIEFELKTK